MGGRAGKMKENIQKPKKALETELIGKIRGIIDYLHPGIEDEMREFYIQKNQDAMKIIKRKADFRLGFHSWFLLKFEFPSGATAMEMADSFPMDYFNTKEKKMIKNFLGYKESLFEILKISEEKKDYMLKDLSDSKIYLIKTIDLPAKLKEKEIIQAIIVRNLNNEYFFYGLITSFDIFNKKEFIKEILWMIKIKEEIRKKRSKNKIEWEILK